MTKTCRFQSGILQPGSNSHTSRILSLMDIIKMASSLLISLGCVHRKLKLVFEDAVVEGM